MLKSYEISNDRRAGALAKNFCSARTAVLAVLVVLSVVSLRAADDAVREKFVPGDALDLVFLGPRHPVFVRLHVQVGGKAFPVLCDTCAEKLFAYCDGDGDGKLDEKESGLIPSRETLNPDRPGARGRPPFAKLDTDSDGGISQDELKVYVHSAMGIPFFINIDRRANLPAMLFRKLDADGDGMLNPEEITTARSRLNKLDIDDDETISLQELQPVQSPFINRIVRGGEDEGPFIALTNPGKLRQLAGRLLSRYDRKTDGEAADGKLDTGELGLSAKSLREVDGDEDGALDRKELVEFLGKPVPAVELLIELRNRVPGLTSVVDPEHASEELVQVGSSSSTRMNLSLDGIKTELRRRGSSSASRDNRTFYRLQFTIADQDKNKYLDSGEFAQLNQQNLQATFETVDRDGDEKVYRAELEQYVEFAAAISVSRSVLTVRDEAQSVFELLDTNLDRRISPREFLSAHASLKEWDKNGDGGIASSELTADFKVTFSLGKPGILAQTTRATTPAPTTPRRPGADASVPVWFDKMDRNRDGDVSKREFLGALKVFKKLDTDEDGLLSPAEAAAMEK